MAEWRKFKLGERKKKFHLANKYISILMKMSLDKAEELVKKKANWIKKQQDFYDTFITIFMPDWKECKKIVDEEFMGGVWGEKLWVKIKKDIFILWQILL